MQDKSIEACELASALADGELQSADLARALGALQASELAQERWHTYHLVGDVLRSGPGAALGAHDPAFLAGVRQRLVQESVSRHGVPQVPAPLRRGASANDPVWRWKLVAGLSSLAVVAVLGWQVAAPSPQAVQMAAPTPAPVPSQALAQAAAERPAMIRDPRLDQLIAEHQQLGGTSALQMPAGFLRNATFERPAR